MIMLENICQKQILEDIAVKEYLMRVIKFLKEFNISNEMTLEEKKYIISFYFKDVADGLLYLKIGIDNIDGFIYYSRS